MGEGLTCRERAVSHFIGEGKTNAEIAVILHTSESGIKQTVTALLRKLGLRHRTEIALWLRQQFLEALIETVPSCIFVVDNDGCIHLFNRACEALTGFSSDEVLGQSVADLLLPPEWREFATQRFTDPDQYVAELRHPHEVPWITRTGAIRMIEWRCTPVVGSDGHSTWLLGAGLDVTAEVEKRREQENLDQIVASNPDGILTVDLDGRYTSWSGTMEFITGVPRQKALGRHWWEAFPFLEEVGIRTYLDQAFAGRTVTTKPLPYEIPETGMQGWFRATYSPLYDVERKITGCIGVIHPVIDEGFEPDYSYLHAKPVPDKEAAQRR